MHDELALDGLADLKYTLHEGQAYDALDTVWEAILSIQSARGYKIQHITSQAASMCSQKIIQDLRDVRDVYVDKYWAAYNVLVTLGLLTNDGGLQPLHNDELWCKVSDEPENISNTSEEDPWFWRIGKPMDGMTDVQWTLECK